MLRFGPDTGPVVVVAMPLLEEWNRTRGFVISILRALAEREIGSALPDLPGQGESTVLTVDARLSDWRDAFSSAVTHAGRGRSLVGTVSIRGGALVEETAPVSHRWRLSPSTGLETGKEWGRLWRLGEKARHPEYDDHRKLGISSLIPITLGPRDVAGNLVHADLREAINLDEPVARTTGVRVVRLESDARPADRKVAGRPLWRGSEPGSDPALTNVLVDDISIWLRTCVA